MAKKHAQILKLDEKLCRLGKISNNLERHGEDYVTGFTIPITELMLTKQELNTFMRDKYCHQSWFNTGTPKNAIEPMPWWNGESFTLHESFEADKGTIIVSGDKPLEFESTGDPKEDDYRAGIVLSGITLTPQTGGLVELRCKIYLLPGIGKPNLVLQDHQHREVRLTLSAALTEREKRQPQLPLDSDNPETTPAVPPSEATLAH